MHDRECGHAIVIGGGIAGMLAATVLSNYFADVTIVERDVFPDVPAFRRGVPQSRHVHGLLARGLDAMDRLLPGLRDELVADGAVPIRFPQDALWLSSGGWSRRFPGIGVLSLSRDLLEWSIRKRVAALCNINFLERRSVAGLLTGRDGRSIAGVELRLHGNPGQLEAMAQRLDADLVIDASGRNSRAADWLSDAGFEAPGETTINAFLGYASRTYGMPPDLDADWKLIILQNRAPDFTRGGGLYPIEGGRWLVTLAGIGGDYPPTDEAGFLDFTRSLRSPILHEMIENAEPISPIHGFRQTENRWRHFERLAAPPTGFVAVGDAACTFNPVYGHGMTMAALDALALRSALAESRSSVALAELPRRFLREAHGDRVRAWQIATSEDMRFPATVGGKRTLIAGLRHRFLGRAIRAATWDRRVNETVANVMNLTAAPTALLEPRTFHAVLRHGGSAPIAEPPTDTPLWRTRGSADRTEAFAELAPASVLGSSRCA